MAGLQIPFVECYSPARSPIRGTSALLSSTPPDLSLRFHCPLPFNAGTHGLLALGVQGTGSLIQDEDPRVPHKGPGNGQTLFLSHS